MAAIGKGFLVELDTKLNHDGVNINFKVAFSNDNSFFVSESIICKFSRKLWAFQNQGVAVDISVDCNIGGALGKLEMISSQVVVIVLIEVWDWEIVHKREQAVKVNVFGLGENADIDWCFERWFGIGETKHHLGADDSKGGKFVAHENYITNSLLST